MKITINLLALSIAIFIYKVYVPRKDTILTAVYSDLKNQFSQIEELEKDARKTLLKEVAILLSLYFGVNFVLGKVK